MNPRQSTANLISSLTCAVCDFLVILSSMWVTALIRFDSGWFYTDASKGRPDDLQLLRLCALAGVVFVLVFQALQLYKRPRAGRFEDTIPRTLRAILIGFVLYVAAEAFTRMDPSFSRKGLLLGLFIVPFFVLLVRYLLYRIEWNLARHMTKINRVLILGTDAVSQRLHRTIEREPFLRSSVIGHLRTSKTDDEDPTLQILEGTLSDVEAICKDHQINHLILCDVGIDRNTLVDISVFCEHHYIQFQMVPDLFRILTTNVAIQDLAGVPMMGLGDWPLDHASNRWLKRAFDIAFSCLALALTSPVLLIAAVAIKLTSKGPVFYVQERCGENGRPFNILKLRTMCMDAEANGPGWTKPDDPRRTPIGGFLRKTNLDELPQFWNVFRGDMSVVGPRPERPHYVEQFKGEIERYMRRHIHKPGITGWAQVNGLRGDTSIEERIRYDLFYLENWSIGLDIKTIVKTLALSKNAY